MKAICAELSFIKPGCPPAVYRSLWDLLCKQLFDSFQIGLDTESTFPNVNIWKDGVALVSKDDTYTFIVADDAKEAPQASDIILYKGKYYIIGSVE